jgi:ribosomal protein S26
MTLGIWLCDKVKYDKNVLDKAIKRFQARNMIDALGKRDIRESSVYHGNVYV